MKIIHLSDLHLVKPGTLLWGLDAHDRVDRCLSDIAAWHNDAEFCVISGDLADKGEPEAYRWLSDRLAAFALPTFLIIGNHDNRARFQELFPSVPRDGDGFVQYAHETDAGVFLFLDTHKGVTPAGQYCPARQAWLVQQLDAAGSRPVWIFMHHPPFDIEIPYMDRIKLDESEAFAGIVAGRANIRHIFFGHVHRPSMINWRGVMCSCLPATAHQVPLHRDSVASRYSDEPVMYAVVHIEEDRTIVHFDGCLNRGSLDMD